MRKSCLNSLYDLAKNDPRIVFVGSDLTAGVLDNFKQEMPSRFFMEGVSEGHIIGMASGLARCGKIVYVNTIAAFLTRRCYEQNVIDLGLESANVRLIANGGGLVYGPLGPTHLAIEDIAIMRVIPNMTVLAPVDAVEMDHIMRASVHHAGPIYLRVAKGGDRVVSNCGAEFVFGKATGLLQNAAGADVTFLTTGVMAAYCLDAADSLLGQGIGCQVVHFHSVKPLDSESVLKALAQSRIVISVEEHLINGGFGSAVAEIVAENAWRFPVLFKRLGLPDAFVERYGSQEDLLRHYRLDGKGIAEQAYRLFRQGTQ